MYIIYRSVSMCWCGCEQPHSPSHSFDKVEHMNRASIGHELINRTLGSVPLCVVKDEEPHILCVIIVL